MKKFVLGLLVGIVMGGTGIGVYSYHAKERQLAALAFGEHLYNAQTATKILRVIDEERYDTVRRLVTLQRDSALDESYRLMVSYEPQVSAFLARTVLPGLDQTEDYLAETDPDNHLRGWLQDVNTYVEHASVEN